MRLLLAAVLGAVIGINRGQLAWTAGLRTHMLVAVGSALAVIVSAFGFFDVLKQPHVILDPSRIAAQVISGIGFLGAGTILFMQREKVVRGLTTAAGLWAVASIGLAAGSGMFLAAVTATAIIWVILALLKPLERRFLIRRNTLLPRIVVRLGTGTALAALESALGRRHLPIYKMILRRQENGEDVVNIQFDRIVHNDQLAALAEEIRRIEGIRTISFNSQK